MLLATANLPGGVAIALVWPVCVVRLNNTNDNLITGTQVSSRPSDVLLSAANQSAYSNARNSSAFRVPLRGSLPTQLSIALNTPGSPMPAVQMRFPFT